MNETVPGSETLTSGLERPTGWSQMEQVSGVMEQWGLWQIDKWVKDRQYSTLANCCHVPVKACGS